MGSKHRETDELARGHDVFSNETIRNYAVKCFHWYFHCFHELC